MVERRSPKPDVVGSNPTGRVLYKARVKFKDKNVNKTKSKEVSEKTESFKEGVKVYLKGVKSEWGKITWPEKNQIIQETIVVLGVVIVFTLMVLLLDIVFKYGVFNWLTEISSRMR